MSDPDFLSAFVEAEVDRFKSGRLSIHSLVSRLEGVVVEANEQGLNGVDSLIDAWERLETYNALALEGGRKGLWARYWSWRARRELGHFEAVARRTLGEARGRGS